MKVNTINEKQVKKDLKTCPKSIKEYIKALENDIVRKQHVIAKAIAKIKEQAKQCNIDSVVVTKGTFNCPECKEPTQITNVSKTNARCFNCGNTWAI